MLMMINIIISIILYVTTFVSFRSVIRQHLKPSGCTDLNEA